jgi:hypothetical protein
MVFLVASGHRQFFYCREAVVLHFPQHNPQRKAVQRQMPVGGFHHERHENVLMTRSLKFWRRLVEPAFDAAFGHLGWFLILVFV